MKTTQGNILHSLRAVQLFLDVNADRLGGVVNTGARKKLDDAIVELSGHVSSQAGRFLDSKASTQRQLKLRTVLTRDHMSPIARIARAQLPKTPDVKPLRMPAGRPTAARLAQHAFGMGEAAAKYAATFTECGLPEDFVARLNAAATAMLEALGDRTQSRGELRGATKGLSVKLSQGRKIVGVLDSFVTSAIHDDPALLAQWNAVKRVKITPVRPAPEAEQSA